jgi:hypothetical protein
MMVRDGRLTLSSGMEYRLIALADREDIALPVLRKLEGLVRDGATLIGRPPTRSNSLADFPECDEEVRRLARLLWGKGPAKGPHRYGKGQVFPDVPLRGVLRGMGLRPDFEVETPAKHGIDYIHRRTETEEIYFVANSTDAPVHAECTFRVACGSRPFLWNPVHGSVAPCPVYRNADGATRVPLLLPQVSSVFVVFRTGEEADHIVDLGRAGREAPGLMDRAVEVLALTPAHVRIRAHGSGTFEFKTARGRLAKAEIADPPPALVPARPWELEFPAGQGAPASLDLGELRSWTDLESEDMRFFAGTARYTTTLQVPGEYLNGSYALYLDLGKVAEVAEVSVNGTPIGILWKAPFRADVTRLLKDGANHLEVRVTNLWHNRIVGDLRSPEAGVHARTNLRTKFHANMDLLPSGLLGPVRLRPVVEVDVPFR